MSQVHLPSSMMFDNTLKKPIGVFDSGVGGLSVLWHIRELLPHENLIYVADSSYAPYGDKTPEFISQRAMFISEHLHSLGAKAIVVACNTATAACIDQLRQTFSIPIVGMEPAVKPAVLTSETGVIGVMATTETLRSEKFSRLSHQFGKDVEIVMQPCPGLVELIESNDIHSDETYSLVSKYVGCLLEKRADVLVLGCTHYPFLMPVIKKIAPDVRVLDTGAAVARELKRRVEGVLKTDQHPGQTRFVTSGSCLAMEKVISDLWKREPITGNQVQSLPASGLV